MAAPNLFQDLKNALTDLKNFLDGPTVTAIGNAIKTLSAVVPQIKDVINDIVGVLTKLDTEIQNLNVGNIPGLDKVGQLTSSIKTVLQSAKAVLPNEADAIDKVIAGADLVTGLPSVGDIKGEIHTLLGDIIGKLNGFKA
jgi:hypothetical protein